MFAAAGTEQEDVHALSHAQYSAVLQADIHTLGIPGSR
jgi:hypothetical protein